MVGTSGRMGLRAAPPVPKARYRSAYVPPDPAALAGVDLATLGDGELALRLIDFSPLEPLLATQYRPSRKGQVPFHPVSLFLAVVLRRELGLGWRALACLLAGPHGAGWSVTRCTLPLRMSTIRSQAAMASNSKAMNAVIAQNQRNHDWKTNNRRTMPPRPSTARRMSKTLIERSFDRNAIMGPLVASSSPSRAKQPRSSRPELRPPAELVGLARERP